jgi:hypothetical protein
LCGKGRLSFEVGGCIFVSYSLLNWGGVDHITHLLFLKKISTYFLRPGVQVGVSGARHAARESRFGFRRNFLDLTFRNSDPQAAQHQTRRIRNHSINRTLPIRYSGFTLATLPDSLRKSTFGISTVHNFVLHRSYYISRRSVTDYSNRDCIAVWSAPSRLSHALFKLLHHHYQRLHPMEAKHWSVRNNEHDVVHDGKIGSGGFGEVHKVSSQSPPLRLRQAVLT